MTEAPGTLLLVDDDEAKRYLLGTWLRRAGHTVTEAETGRDALGRLDGIELVLLDVNLPDMSGYEVCRLIKGDPRTAAIPVIQVSATAVEVADRAHGLTQGADAYLIEPTEPAELLATVTAALRYYRARQRAERTASRLAALVSATLDINAAETFDGLAAAAATGAARIFSVHAILIVEMPDGQDRRVAATPGSPGTVRRGGKPGLASRVAERVLGPSQVSGIASLSAEEWLRIVPDSTLRVDVCVAAARIKPGKPAAALTVDYAGIAGEEDMQILSQLTQSVALGLEALRSFAEEHLVALTLQRSFLPATLPADTRRLDGVPVSARERPGRGRRRLLRGAALARRGAGGHRRRAGALAARGHRDGRAAARAARVRQRGAPAGGDHRAGQRGPAPLPPGAHRHLVPGAARSGQRRAHDRELRAHAAPAGGRPGQSGRAGRGLCRRGRTDARPDPP